MITEKEELASHLSDYYKEVHGVRPRHFNIDAMSIQDIQDELDELQETVELQRMHELKLKADKAHAERKKLNAYKPNNLFAGLKDLLNN